MLTRITFLVAILLIAQVSCQCPNGYQHHGSSCYHVVRVRATWAEASTYCRAFGSRLVSIETRDENHFIVNLLKHKQNDYIPPKFWIGGNDFAQTGTWKWEKVNEKIMDGYHSWYKGILDNGGTEADEHCLEMQAEHGWKWNDSECRNKFYPVCETEDLRAVTPASGIIIG